MSKKMIHPYINNIKPDILCITETKADEKNFDSSHISLHGYQSYWNFSKHSSGYSGVAVFSKYLPKSAEEDMLER
jgi:exodeoxyribonuclease III